mmetsp:Transcript_117744/g.327941  ORF Transcript_117744/g.327941 Transcript_117744/m.327941 type:complete len:915 (-) Transcript_117744:159-2903(-)
MVALTAGCCTPTPDGAPSVAALLGALLEAGTPLQPRPGAAVLRGGREALERLSCVGSGGADGVNVPRLTQLVQEPSAWPVKVEAADEHWRDTLAKLILRLQDTGTTGGGTGEEQPEDHWRNILAQLILRLQDAERSRGCSGEATTPKGANNCLHPATPRKLLPTFAASPAQELEQQPRPASHPIGPSTEAGTLRQTAVPTVSPAAGCTQPALVAVLQAEPSVQVFGSAAPELPSATLCQALTAEFAAAAERRAAAHAAADRAVADAQLRSARAELAAEVEVQRIRARARAAEASADVAEARAHVLAAEADAAAHSVEVRALARVAEAEAEAEAGTRRAGFELGFGHGGSGLAAAGAAVAASGGEAHAAPGAAQEALTSVAGRLPPGLGQRMLAAELALHRGTPDGEEAKAAAALRDARALHAELESEVHTGRCGEVWPLAPACVVAWGVSLAQALDSVLRTLATPFRALSSGVAVQPSSSEPVAAQSTVAPWTESVSVAEGSPPRYAAAAQPAPASAATLAAQSLPGRMPRQTGPQARMNWPYRPEEPVLTPPRLQPQPEHSWILSESSTEPRPTSLAAGGVWPSRFAAAAPEGQPAAATTPTATAAPAATVPPRPVQGSPRGGRSPASTSGGDASADEGTVVSDEKDQWDDGAAFRAGPPEAALAISVRSVQRSAALDRARLREELRTLRLQRKLILSREKKQVTPPSSPAPGELASLPGRRPPSPPAGAAPRSPSPAARRPPSPPRTPQASARGARGDGSARAPASPGGPARQPVRSRPPLVPGSPAAKKCADGVDMGQLAAALPPALAAHVSSSPAMTAAAQRWGYPLSLGGPGTPRPGPQQGQPCAGRGPSGSRRSSPAPARPCGCSCGRVCAHCGGARGSSPAPRRSRPNPFSPVRACHLVLRPPAVSA